MKELRDFLFQQIKKEIPEIKLNGHPEAKITQYTQHQFPRGRSRPFT